MTRRDAAFAGDRRGAVAPLFALAMVVLLGCAGLGIDFGVAVNQKRRLQTAVDIAALTAANARDKVAAATLALVDNGFAAPADLTVTAGTYRADRSLAIDARFSEGGAAPNATRVSASASVATGFSHLVGGPAMLAMSASATAIQADFAAFGIGSRVAALDGGIGNALLTRLLGTSAALSVIDYRALAGLNIDALTFLGNAALRGRIQAATFGEVLAGSLTLGELALALADTARAAPGGFDAAQALSRLAAGTGSAARVRLGDLLAVGDAAQAPLTAPGSPLTVGALGLLSAGAVLANGTNPLGLDLGATVPGLLGAKVTLRVGEAWRTSGFVAPGASLAAAQVRALVEVSLPAPLGLGELRIPIYLEVGRARAALTRIACPWTARNERAVTLDATTGPAYLAVGETPLAALDPDGPRPALAPTAILRVPLLEVRASARVEIAAATRSLSFTDADIAAGRTRTVTSDRMTTSLARSLFSSLTLDVNGLPLGGILNLQQLIGTTLGLAAPAVDGLLDALLATLGIQVGAADVSVDGTRCGGAALIQ